MLSAQVHENFRDFHTRIEIEFLKISASAAILVWLGSNVRCIPQIMDNLCSSYSDEEKRKQKKQNINVKVKNHALKIKNQVDL